MDLEDQLNSFLWVGRRIVTIPYLFAKFLKVAVFLFES